MTLPEFLHEQDGEIRLVGSRIGLAHVVRLYQTGETAEMICLEFPSLPLSQVHKVIGFYLEHQQEVDDYVCAEDRLLEELRAKYPSPSVAELRERLGKQQSEALRKGA
jgi:uncharacterized protein (DUF433 family)